MRMLFHKEFYERGDLCISTKLLVIIYKTALQNLKFHKIPYHPWVEAKKNFIQMLTTTFSLFYCLSVCLFCFLWLCLSELTVCSFLIYPHRIVNLLLSEYFFVENCGCTFLKWKIILAFAILSDVDFANIVSLKIIQHAQIHTQIHIKFNSKISLQNQRHTE